MNSKLTDSLAMRSNALADLAFHLQPNRKERRRLSALNQADPVRNCACCIAPAPSRASGSFEPITQATTDEHD